MIPYPDSGRMKVIRFIKANTSPRYVMTKHKKVNSKEEKRKKITYEHVPISPIAECSRKH
jgi:hypothetical protein